MNTKNTKKFVEQEYQAILSAETSAADPLKRRVLRDERLKLHSTLSARPLRFAECVEQAEECRRVREMWS